MSHSNTPPAHDIKQIQQDWNASETQETSGDYHSLQIDMDRDTSDMSIGTDTEQNKNLEREVDNGLRDIRKQADIQPIIVSVPAQSSSQPPAVSTSGSVGHANIQPAILTSISSNLLSHSPQVESPSQTNHPNGAPKRVRDEDDSNPTQRKIIKRSQNHKHKLPNQPTTPAAKSKPPPIVLEDRRYFPRIELHLKTMILKEKFEAVLMGPKLAIKTFNEHDHLKILNYVRGQNINSQSRPLQSDKVKRYVIRGIVPETNHEDIKSELIEMGIEVLKVLPMQKKSGTLLPLCTVEMPFTSNGSKLLEVTTILHQKVKVEEEYYRGPPICRNCFSYVHTHKGCNFTTACPFCTESHQVGACKGNPANPQCRKCGNYGHKPIFKGCPKYQEHCKKEGKTIDSKVQRTFSPAPNSNPWNRDASGAAGAGATGPSSDVDLNSSVSQSKPQHTSTPTKTIQSIRNKPGKKLKVRFAEENQTKQPLYEEEQSTDNNNQTNHTAPTSINPQQTNTAVSEPSANNSPSDEFSLKDLISLLKQLIQVFRTYKKDGLMAALDALTPILEAL